MNVLDKLPRAERPEAVKRIRAIWQAGSEDAARRLPGGLGQELPPGGHDPGPGLPGKRPGSLPDVLWVPGGPRAAPADDEPHRVTVRLGAAADPCGPALQEDQERRVADASDLRAAESTLAAPSFRP